MNNIEKLFKRYSKYVKYLAVFTCVVSLLFIFSPLPLNAQSSPQIKAFVTRFYQQCLGREPDSAGLDKWASALVSGSKTGEDIAKGFIFSQEFISRNLGDQEFVTVLYRAFFNREPDLYGFSMWVSRLNSGMSRESVVDGFLKSSEFASLCSHYGIIPYKGATTGITGVQSNFAYGSLGTTSGFQSGRKVNFIIWGDDSAHDRPGGRVSGRTDINIFVHLNLDTRKAYVVTIPRDTWFNGRKINGYHALYGHDGAVQAFERFTGMEIDFYVITDFDGFISLIDYLGGVTTTVEENIQDPFSGCYLGTGVHSLNGTQALALTRARKGRVLYGGGAYAREKQSAMLLVDLLFQKRSMVNSGNLSSFLASLTQHVWTNISLSQASQILPALLSMRREDITITTFNSWPQWFGNSSAVGYNEAEKNQFFNFIASQ